MRPGIAATPLDARRSARVGVYAAGTAWADAIGGDAAPLDLSPRVRSARHTQDSAEVRLSGEVAVRPGQLLELAADGVVVFRGQVTEIRNAAARRGANECSLVARSREQTPLWKDLRYSSGAYPVGTQLTAILADLLDGIGAQYTLPAAGAQVPHSNVQFADLSLWEMLTELCLPLLLRPGMDALGRFRGVAIDTRRPADLDVGWERVVSLDRSDSGTPLSGVRVRWTDPKLSEVVQAERKLAEATLTAGFFQREQRQALWFSEDHSQRARNTRLKVLQSVNSGLLPVGEESWEPRDAHGGVLTVTTSAWVPALATAELAGLLLEAAIGDEVTFPGSLTVPVGKVIQTQRLVAMLLIMLSLGTGVYEIWGEPYDSVHALNTSEAYDPAAPLYLRAETELRSDLVANEVHAQAIAVHELLYRNYSAERYNATLVDYPGLEVGDILAFPDGSRLYVTGYARDLTRGAAALLAVEGFRC